MQGGWIITGVSRAPRARIEAHGVPHGRIVGHGESAGAPRARIEAHGVSHGRIVGYGESVGGGTIRYGLGRPPAGVVKRPQGACIPRGESRRGWLVTKYMEK